MAFKIVDLMSDVLPEGEAEFAREGCTGASCREAGTKEGPRGLRPTAAMDELAVLRNQLRLLQA